MYFIGSRGGGVLVTSHDEIGYRHAILTCPLHRTPSGAWITPSRPRGTGHAHRVCDWPGCSHGVCDWWGGWEGGEERRDDATPERQRHGRKREEEVHSGAAEVRGGAVLRRVRGISDASPPALSAETTLISGTEAGTFSLEDGEKENLDVSNRASVSCLNFSHHRECSIGTLLQLYTGLGLFLRTSSVVEQFMLLCFLWANPKPCPMLLFGHLFQTVDSHFLSQKQVTEFTPY